MEKVCGLFQKPFLTFQKILLINAKTLFKKKRRTKKLVSTASPSPGIMEKEMEPTISGLGHFVGSVGTLSQIQY